MRSSSHHALCAGIAATVLAACVGAPDESDDATEFVSEEASSGSVFSIHCDAPSHQLKDDPIVYPGVPGVSHMHDFMGNKSTNAFSTYATMTAASTVCHLAQDTAGYWAPSLLSPAGKMLLADHNTAYYRADGSAVGKVKAFPPNFRMIAGYPTIQTGTDNLGWSCDDNSPYQAHPLNCTNKGTGHLKGHIVFPSCWDGVHTDSVDHRSHIVYPVGGKCPADHPVRMPRLSVHITYGVVNALGYGLSSDMMWGVKDGESLHSDFWNTWQQPKLQSLVDTCLNAGKTCLDVTK